MACTPNTSGDKTYTQSMYLASLFEVYHHHKSGFNLVEATKGGYYEYNDRVANYISDSYHQELIDFYEANQRSLMIHGLTGRYYGVRQASYLLYFLYLKC